MLTIINIEVKPNVKMGSDEKFLVKANVHAAMKQKSYAVYVHLNQATGESCSYCLCKAGKGSCCKHVHVAALLFHEVIDYIQFELSEVPDDLTCMYPTSTTEACSQNR